MRAIVGIALKFPEEYMRGIAVGLGAALLGCASPVGDSSNWETPDGANFDQDYYECLKEIRWGVNLRPWYHDQLHEGEGLCLEGLGESW
jgi:hypothetical protein